MRIESVKQPFVECGTDERLARVRAVRRSREGRAIEIANAAGGSDEEEEELEEEEKVIGEVDGQVDLETWLEEAEEQERLLVEAEARVQVERVIAANVKRGRKNS